VRLTIIPSDGAVYKDEISYLNLTWGGTPLNVHALQWFSNEGWIEFKNNTPNQTITELPVWAENALAAWTAENIKPPPEPLPPTVEENQAEASQRLYNTDWTTIPDVSDPAKSNPYLGNVENYVVYRNAIRQYAINPVSGYIDWPIEPKAFWIYK
jgi:hypothetical protein